MTDKSIGANIWGLDTRVVSATTRSSIFRSLALFNTLPWKNVYGSTIEASVFPTRTVVLDSGSYSSGYTTESYTITYYNTAGDQVGTGTGTWSVTVDVDTGIGVETHTNMPGYIKDIEFYAVGVTGAKPDAWSNVNLYRVIGPHEAISSASWATPSPSYSSVLAADLGAGVGGVRDIIYTSSQDVLAFQATSITSVGPVTYGRYALEPLVHWNGVGFAYRMEIYQNSDTFESTKTIQGSISYYVPDNCVGPVSAIPDTPYFANGIDDSVIYNTAILEDISDRVTVPADERIYGYKIDYYDLEVSNLVAPMLAHIVVSRYRYSETQSEADIAGRPRAFYYIYQATQQEIIDAWLVIKDAIDTQIRTTRAVGNTAVFNQQYAANQQWYSWQDALVARRNKHFLKSSDTFLRTLVTAVKGDNILPAPWSDIIRRNAPVSAYTYRDIPLSLAISDQINTATVGTVITTRTATFSYTVPEDDGSGGTINVTHTAVIVGTKTVVTIDHVTASGSHDSSYITTYNNYVDTQGGYPLYSKNAVGVSESVQLYRSVSSVSSPSFLDFAGVANGIVVSGATKLYGSSEYGYEPSNPVGRPGMFTPAYPSFFSSYVSSMPSIVKAYRKAVPLEYSETRAYDGSYNTWNDANMSKGMAIKVCLFGPAGKGIFGEWGIEDTAMDVYGYIVLQYDYDTAVLSFVRWSPATDQIIDSTFGLGKIPVPKHVFRGPGVTDRTNAIVSYDNVRWADLKEKAAYEKTVLRGNRGKPKEEQSLQYIILSALGLI